MAILIATAVANAIPAIILDTWREMVTPHSHCHGPPASGALIGQICSKHHYKLCAANADTSRKTNTEQYKRRVQISSCSSK